MNNGNEKASRRIGFLGVILFVVVLLAGGFVLYQKLGAKQPGIVPSQAVVRVKIPPMPGATGSGIQQSVVSKVPAGQRDESRVSGLGRDIPKVEPAPDAGGVRPAAESTDTEQNDLQAPMASQVASDSSSTTIGRSVRTPATENNDHNESVAAGSASGMPSADSQERPNMDTLQTDDGRDPANGAAQPGTMEKSQPAGAPDAAMAANSIETPQPPAPYTIQVGAFRNKAYADQTVEGLKAKGYDSYIFESTDKNERVWYLVRFGHFQDRPSASKALTLFKNREKMEGAIARSHPNQP